MRSAATIPAAASAAAHDHHPESRAVGEAGHRPGTCCAARGARGLSQERRVLAQHRLLELSKRSTRLDPELAHEQLPCPPEQLQCVCLPSRPDTARASRAREVARAAGVTQRAPRVPARCPPPRRLRVRRRANPRRRPAGGPPTLPRHARRTALEIRATPGRARGQVPGAFLRPRPLASPAARRSRASAASFSKRSTSSSSSPTRSS